MKEEKYESLLNMFSESKYEDLKNTYTLSMIIAQKSKIF